MANEKSLKPNPTKKPPAKTPDENEKRCISLAMEVAQKRMLDGTASSQIILHFLQLGSSTAQIEKEILKGQKDLIHSKIDKLKSEVKSEQLFAEAISAMRSYGGSLQEDEDD